MNVLNVLMILNGSLSTFLNFVVIYMVFMKSTNEIRQYKWFLLNNAVWDLLFNVVVSFFFAPEPLLFDSGGALIVTGVFKSSGFQSAKWLTLITNAILVGSCAAVCACFVFRYFCIQSPSVFQKFLSIHVMGSLCACYCLVIVITLLLTNAAILDPSEWSMNLLNKLRNSRPTIDKEFFIVIDITKNWWLIAVVIWAAGGVCGMVVINFSCTFLIMRTLNSIKINLSKQTYKMHKELMIALILQTICPLIALIVPFSSMVFSSVLGIQLPFGTNWLIFLSTLNAITNPLFTLYFVKAYWYQIFPRNSRMMEQTTTVMPARTVQESGR